MSEGFRVLDDRTLAGDVRQAIKQLADAVKEAEAHGLTVTLDWHAGFGRVQGATIVKKL